MLETAEAPASLLMDGYEADSDLNPQELPIGNNPAATMAEFLPTFVKSPLAIPYEMLLNSDTTGHDKVDFFKLVDAFLANVLTNRLDLEILDALAEMFVKELVLVIAPILCRCIYEIYYLLIIIIGSNFGY